MPQHQKRKSIIVVSVAALVLIAALFVALQLGGIFDTAGHVSTLLGRVDNTKLIGNFSVTKYESGDAEGTQVVTAKVDENQKATFSANDYPEGHTFEVSGTLKKTSATKNLVTYKLDNPKLLLDGQDAVKTLASQAGVAGLADLASSLVSVQLTAPVGASQGNFTGEWSLTASATAAYSVQLKATAEADGTFQTTTSTKISGSQDSMAREGTWKKVSEGKFDVALENQTQNYTVTLPH